MSVLKSAAIVAASLLGAAQLAPAATYTFQDGSPAPVVGGAYDGTQDVSIYGDNPLLNTGTMEIQYASPGRKILLSFDVSALSGQGAVQSAKLKLTQETPGGADALVSFSVYQVTDANAGWNQGAQMAGAAANGDPCWNDKSYDTIAPIAWAGSAGLETAGVDYVATSVATGVFHQTADSSASTGTVIELELPAALIEHWIAGPNAGVVIAVDANEGNGWPAVQFVSAESSYQPVSWRPALEVTVVPEPAALSLLGLGALALRRRRA